MKSTIKTLFISVCLIIVAVTDMVAHDIEVNGIYYNILSVENRTMEVTKGDVAYKGDVTIPERVELNGISFRVVSIGEYAFSASGTKSVTALFVQKISQYAFHECKTLTSADFPLVKTIGEGAFRENKALTSINIPSVTSIGNWTFSECTKLEKIFLPNAVSIGRSAFWGCKSMASAHLPKVKSAVEMSFAHCSSLETISMPNAETIGMGIFSDCTNLKTVSIPLAKRMETNSYYHYREGAFSGCTNLVSVSIPSLECVPYEAFKNCTSLQEVSFPKVTYVEENAFIGCSALELISIPLVTTISTKAFMDCGKIDNLYLPKSLTSIGSQAFDNCKGIKNVVSAIETPFRINDNTFSGVTYVLATLSVPEGRVDRYKNTSGWKEFINIKENNGEVTNHNISLEAVEGGRVNINGETITGNATDISIEENSDVMITIIPDAGMQLASALLNGKDITKDIAEDGTFLIHSVQGNITLAITFEPIPIYLICKYADQGCFKLHVTEGSKQKISISPENGWRIHSVLFNETDVTEQLTQDNVFTTPAILATSTLNVVFEQDSPNALEIQTTTPMFIQVHGNTLSVKNGLNNEKIQVYNLDGQLVKNLVCKNGVASCYLNPNNTYIIKTQNKTFKVRM